MVSTEEDNKVHVGEGFDYYSVFSLWDTFRAAHPFVYFNEKKRTADFINTFLKQYEQGGRLPVWELASNENRLYDWFIQFQLWQMPWQKELQV
jgi:putative alpha-1,2-mannosidase